MARRNVVLVIALFIVLTLSACRGKPTPDVQVIETQTAAKIFATQTASVPIQTGYTPTDAAPAIDARPAGVPLSWVRYSDSTGRFTVWHPASWEANLSAMQASRDNAYFNTPNGYAVVGIIGGMGTDDVLDETLQTLVIDTVRETQPNITIDRREGIGAGRYVSFTAKDPASTITFHVVGVALASPPQNVVVGFLFSFIKPLSATEQQELVDALGSISLSAPRTETTSLIVTTREPTATSELNTSIPPTIAPTQGATPMPPRTDLCNYARSAVDAVTTAQGVLAEANVYDKAQLRRTAEQLTALAYEFGHRQTPTGANDLQMWTVGAISAASQMVDEWVAGSDGQTEAAFYLQLLRSATEEANRVRQEQNCG